MASKKFTKRILTDGVTATTLTITRVIKRKPGVYDVMYSTAGQSHLEFVYGRASQSGSKFFLRPTPAMEFHHSIETPQFKAGILKRIANAEKVAA